MRYPIEFPDPPVDGSVQDKMVWAARLYIALSNALTTKGMEDVFAASAVYESAPAPDGGGPNTRLVGRDEVLRAHQAFFDSLERGRWTVPAQNYRVTKPDTVEFAIPNVTYVLKSEPVAVAFRAHEIMRFDRQGRAVYVTGQVTGQSAPLDF